MSDTPRTNAAAYQVSEKAEGLIMTPAKFARQLERELNALKQERADFGALVDKLERELNAAKAEIEAMKKAIKTAADSLDGLDLHLPRNHGMFLLLALEKLQPFLK